MTDLPPHKIHAETGISQFDVFIAGSGPIGATFARLLVNKGYKVCLAEIGDQDTRIPGAHKKNEIEYQKDIDRFVKVIQGALSSVSIPVSSTVMPTADPSSWKPVDPKQSILSNGRNPFQAEHNNLGAQAVTRGVGGMSTHWTCATPEFLKGKDEQGQHLERPEIFTDTAKDDAEWALLYNAARVLIGTSEKEYDHSIRHNVVLKALRDAYPDRGVKPLPLACHRLPNDSPYVQWHAADNVYGDLFTSPKRERFALITNTRCTKLHIDPNGSSPHEVKFVEVKDLLLDRYLEPSQTNFAISAKAFIVAAGAVATPQILANSGFGGKRDQQSELVPNIGKYITEQPMAFCQIVLRQGLVDDVANLTGKPDWWVTAVKRHQQSHPKDPCPIPFQDGEPQVTIPASAKRPWHTQIHRDAFSYGEAGPRVDSRVVVDLRFFGRQEGYEKNRLIFENDLTDAYGMPQPTFVYDPTPARALETSQMMNDMTDVANRLGGYLPGSNPQFMTPGLALHLGGTTRLGQDKKQSTGNYDSQIWGFKNLYVGGNGLIPTAFAANPTLTSMCLAIRAAYKLHKDLEAGNFTEPVDGATLEPTPTEWVAWTDPTHPDYPDHKKLRELHRRV